MQQLHGKWVGNVRGRENRESRISLTQKRTENNDVEGGQVLGTADLQVGCPSVSKSRFSLAQLLEEQTNRLDPAMEVRNVKLLIRSVQVVVRQAEAHHHTGDLQHILKIGHDWNRA